LIEIEFFGCGAGKKLGLSPGSTEPSISREETEFFRCGAGKNSVSPLKEPGHGQAEKRPSFSGVARVKLGLSILHGSGLLIGT
jgi:hypothetical protein